jgi:Polyketide cyclase / dehydrase and lipid transport
MRDMVPMTLDDAAAAPIRVGGRCHFQADPHAVFEELRDPSLWFPLMRRSVWRTGATSGVGAEREIAHPVLGRFRERMLVWDPGERMTFTMLATNSPFIARSLEDWQLRGEAGGTVAEWLVAGYPTKAGRFAAPALRATVRLLFAGAARTLGRRAATYPRGKQAI